MLDADLEATLAGRRARAAAHRGGTPRFGRELDDRVLPAEAGLDERAISFTKGCYPGQEPIARQHHRGKVNRRLRVLEVDGDAGGPGTPVVYGDKDVGRITSAVRGLALAYVRVEVPDDAALDVGGAPTGRRGYTDRSLAPVAQGIERRLAEAGVASSNPAGRIS